MTQSTAQSVSNLVSFQHGTTELVVVYQAFKRGGAESVPQFLATLKLINSRVP